VSTTLVLLPSTRARGFSSNRWTPSCQASQVVTERQRQTLAMRCTNDFGCIIYHCRSRHERRFSGGGSSTENHDRNLQPTNPPTPRRSISDGTQSWLQENAWEMKHKHNKKTPEYRCPRSFLWDTHSMIIDPVWIKKEQSAQIDANVFRPPA